MKRVIDSLVWLVAWPVWQLTETLLLLVDVVTDIRDRWQTGRW